MSTPPNRDRPWRSRHVTSFDQVSEYYPTDTVSFRETPDVDLNPEAAVIRKKVSHARLNELRAAAAASAETALTTSNNSSLSSNSSCSTDVPVAAFDHLVEDQNLRYEFFHVSMCDVQSRRCGWVGSVTVFPVLLVTNCALVRRSSAVAKRSFGEFREFADLLRSSTRIFRFQGRGVPYISYVAPFAYDSINHRKDAIKSFMLALVKNSDAFHNPIFHLFLYTDVSLKTIRASYADTACGVDVPTDIQDYERDILERPLTAREVWTFSEIAQEGIGEFGYDLVGDEAIPDELWDDSLEDIPEEVDDRDAGAGGQSPQESPTGFPISPLCFRTTPPESEQEQVARSFLNVGVEERVREAEDGAGPEVYATGTTDCIIEAHRLLIERVEGRLPRRRDVRSRNPRISLRTLKSSSSLALRDSPGSKDCVASSCPSAEGMWDAFEEQQPQNSPSETGLWMGGAQLRTVKTLTAIAEMADDADDTMRRSSQMSSSYGKD